MRGVGMLSLFPIVQPIRLSGGRKSSTRRWWTRRSEADLGPCPLIFLSTIFLFCWHAVEPRRATERRRTSWQHVLRLATRRRYNSGPMSFPAFH